FKRPLSIKQSIKEWPHRPTAVFNGFWGKIPVFCHEASECDQHMVIDSYGFGCGLEAVKRGQPFNRLRYEVLPRIFSMSALAGRPSVTEPSPRRFFDLRKVDSVV